MSPDVLVPSYTVISRHEKDCKHKSKGRSHLQCGCFKQLDIYDPRIADPKKRQRRISLKTRDPQAAEQIAQSYRDSHNADKVRAKAAEDKLKALQLEKESQSVTIERAVGAFLAWKADNPSRRSSNLSGKTASKTLDNYRGLLGTVDPQGKVLRKGHLFAWLENVNPRPILISDLTPVMVDSFRAGWKMSDNTGNKNYKNLNAFFDYCRDRGRWIERNPMDGLRAPSVQDGNRTGAFTAPQYQSILDTLANREQTAETRRLLTIVELMRWSGMAIIDATDFSQTTLTANKLRYRRRKTNNQAKPNLPAHVVELLRTVEPINGDLDKPFRNVKRLLNGDTDYWRVQICQLFEDAGIKTVKTDVGLRPPRPHMLRDIFAINQLKTQYELGRVNHQAIADALGDSIATFLKYYKPWIDELEQAHDAEQNAIVEAQEAKLAKQEQGAISIGRGRK